MDLRLEYFSKYPRVPLHPLQPSWAKPPFAVADFFHHFFMAKRALSSQKENSSLHWMAMLFIVKIEVNIKVVQINFLYIMIMCGIAPNFKAFYSLLYGPPDHKM